MRGCYRAGSCWHTIFLHSCVNSPHAARGSQEAVFTQPSLHISLHVCIVFINQECRQLIDLKLTLGNISTIINQKVSQSGNSWGIVRHNGGEVSKLDWIKVRIITPSNDRAGSSYRSSSEKWTIHPRLSLERGTWDYVGLLPIGVRGNYICISWSWLIASLTLFLSDRIPH